MSSAFVGLRDPEGHVWYVGTYDPWDKPTG
jgi:uncharacterized glyoxalase superfamily protein PhnB